MKALITGITGFAGSHLAEYLLAEHPGVEVYGTYRWRSRMDNVEHIRSRIKLLEADLRDYTSMHAALEKSRTVDILDFVKADEIDDRYFETPYYLLPAKGGGCIDAQPAGFGILTEAIDESGR